MPKATRPYAEMTAPLVRDARSEDLDAITAIYGHHVRHGLASFEESSPDRTEIERRWNTASAAGMPYLVAELDGAVIGFAYGSKYRPRPAYRHTVEDSVYVAPEMAGRGAGRALLAALIERCAIAGFKQIVAVIGDSENDASISLHAHLGFRRVGVLQDVGFKHERWVDTVLMQRALGSG